MITGFGVVTEAGHQKDMIDGEKVFYRHLYEGTRLRGTIAWVQGDTVACGYSLVHPSDQGTKFEGRLNAFKRLYLQPKAFGPFSRDDEDMISYLRRIR